MGSTLEPEECKHEYQMELPSVTSALNQYRVCLKCGKRQIRNTFDTDGASYDMWFSCYDVWELRGFKFGY